MKHSFKLRENVRLAPYTTLGIGGPARFFIKAENEEHVIQAFEYAEENSLDVFVLGGGSNVLIADKGFDGLVLQIALRGIAENPDATPTTPSASRPPLLRQEGSITAKAGEDWDQFVEFCVEKDLAGIECLSGIPGTVGGTPVQNVGAYGQEVSETIVSVKCFDRKEKRICELSNADCGFTYRKSIFNTNTRDRYVVLEVTYALQKGGEAKIIYKDLKEFFEDKKPALRQTRDAVLHIRSAKSMVIDPQDPNSKSAGSFFKNPIVSNEQYSQITASFEKVPCFKMDEENVKIPAAWLIERAGFEKGYRHGNAGISENHTLAIINRGGATALEVIELKEKIQTAVDSKFGILLQPEPVFIGF